jgi:hypothetical protein
MSTACHAEVAAAEAPAAGHTAAHLQWLQPGLLPKLCLQAADMPIYSTGMQQLQHLQWKGCNIGI